MLREEQNGKFFMGGQKENYSSLILPGNALENEFKKAKLEKEAEEGRTLLLELERKKQEELNNKLEKLELLPLGNKVIILPYPVNPYRKAITNGGIILDYTGQFDNPDTGEKDKTVELVACAKVIEIGPEVKYLQVGDDIYYDPRTTYPVPFMSLGYKLTTEPQVLCVLNESLKERFKMI